ncbi:hypothetical protein GUITHDRAFT_133670 [Guillardia theta CCMP2712]|uniref:50S ribosomal protein L9, chloroplastic n=1 Tax=Guillardia theta (strain CCMP2712) TaxID=905079 RepID=L1JWY9_GUITC|nr:hypothetical protein GUITHDRAFT_133670 [Guillardia theta CCMP2712]EKX52623.1 hypothetical protein GUITHDRAFT_133670 [Guillardia theta CCMP2712]|mmetsp:Transcript_51303/g.160206  ORF Transcript_51303/g.160206 Transcript_51303/m.160206 type:complete len:179 (-) Transcript_51303:171-707(-)|eukprot:XP_005839603.1 hypothetical protein GUITHDRAFT_133670 [Guillardia theta CCMP2712]
MAKACVPQQTSALSLAWRMGSVRGVKASSRTVKVILKQDMEHLGFRGELHAVRPGHARNYLIPQKIAVYATLDNMQKYLTTSEEEAQLKNEEKIRQRRMEKQLSKLKLTMKRHSVEDGKLYGSVTAKNISDKLAKIDMEIKPEDILLEAPIKELGSFDIPVRWEGNRTATLKLEVLKR